MARLRKSATPAMNEAEQKINGMRSISSTLDLSNNVSVSQGDILLGNAQDALNRYNELLAEADALLNLFNSEEKALKAFNKKILPAVGLKYGTDSSEYEKVGGVRESERKKPVRKPKS